MSPDGQTKAYIDEYHHVSLGCDYYQAQHELHHVKLLLVATNAHHAKDIEMHLELCA